MRAPSGPDSGGAWWPLSQNGDPAKGDPGALAAHVAAYTKIANQATATAKTLSGLCVDEFWDSDSGTAFKVRCDNLAAELTKIVSRYQTAAAALNAYIPDLEHAQSSAATALTLGNTAQDDFASIGYTYSPGGTLGAPAVSVQAPFAPTTPQPKPMSPTDPHWSKYQSAAQEWNTAVRRVDDARHLHDTSATTAARKIKAVAEGDGASNQNWTALDAQQRGFLAELTNPATVESAVLNLPLVNPNGEQNGGVNPNLPIDPAVLQAVLDDLRAKNVDPKQYKTLLDQYWVATAAQHAGIDLNEWDPQAGTGANMGNIQAVYTYYGNLFLNHPELQWAGMANMIGPSFAGGFLDIDMFRKMAQEFATKVNGLPAAVRASLPPQLRLLAQAGGLMTAGELQYFESKFLAMQKHIFFDQAAAHEAYLAGPPNNIIATPVQDRIAEQRLSARWPTIADDLLEKDWSVKVDHHFKPGFDIP